MSVSLAKFVSLVLHSSASIREELIPVQISTGADVKSSLLAARVTCAISADIPQATCSTQILKMILLALKIHRRLPQTVFGRSLGQKFERCFT